MKYEIKELGLGGILDQAVALLKNHFGLLLGIALCFMVPVNLAMQFGVQALMPQISENPSPAEMEMFAAQMQQAAMTMMGIVIGFMVVMFLFVWPMTNAAAFHAVSQKYLGREAGIGESIGFAFKRLPSLLWTNLIAMILISLGFVLLIIPGIVLIFRYFLGSHVVVLEEKSGMAALNRSRDLMKGNGTKVFVLSFLLGVIGWLVGMGIAFIPSQEATIVVSVLVNGILFMLGAAAWTVLYYSARCKLENFDLALLAEGLGQDAPAQPGA